MTSVHPVFDGRIFRKQCCSLAKRYEVSLIAPNTDDRVEKGVIIKGVKLPKSRFKRLLCLNRLYRMMLEINADVHHFHDPELLPIGIKAHHTSGKGLEP